MDQLVRHSDGFSDEAQKILLLLTRESLADAQREKICEQVLRRNPGVVFASITFEEICKIVTTLSSVCEEEVAALCQDFVDYCNDTTLFDQSKHLMRILPCSETAELNLKYGICFQRIDRSYTAHSYIGVYAEKSVKGIFKIDSAFDVALDADEKLAKCIVMVQNTDVYDEKIRAIIHDAKTHCGYEISRGYRFFCGKPVTTNYKKVIPRSILGPRFVNLRDVLGQEPGDIESIAAILQNKSWE